MLAKLQKIVFIILLIFLPSQLGFHFWPDWAYINGIRVDYFSPTLYFTDVLVIIFIILNFIPIQSGLKKCFKSKKIIYFFLFFLSFIVLNTYFSLSPIVTLYKWFKFFEFSLFAYCIFLLKSRQSGTPPRRWFKIKILNLLIIPILYSCVLAIWQFVNQASVGGIWYFLGERTFNSSTPGIANAVINGQMVLRPYGTFPHPNVLTGFLIITGLILIKFIPHISRKITALVLVMVIVVLFLTPSRGNLLNGLNIRQQFNNVAVNQWITSPVWGTGLGTSSLYTTGVKNYALAHQPTHNIYLLLLSETGVLGLIAFLYLIKKRFSLLLLPILFIGIFDHYWLTLQQGQLLLALVLGLSSIIKKT